MSMLFYSCKWMTQAGYWDRAFGLLATRSGVIVLTVWGWR
jgi:hypothetical protein